MRKNVITFVIFVISLFFFYSLAHADTVCIKSSIKRNQFGAIARSQSSIAAFKKLYACPATGKHYGACPGYVIDHKDPLACCGQDDPSNMQWQLYAASKVKDSTELQCKGKILK
jgi:hypothetical protein